jgi:aspartyl protease family protein
VFPNKPWAHVGIWFFLGLVLYAVIAGLTAEGPLTVDQDITREGALELRQARDGHYYLVGAIDGHTITFLIDTGASRLTLSARQADQLGLTRCRPARARTANGVVDACVTQAGTLTLGPFHIEKPEINILPGLSGPALLGMNVLDRFSLTQQAGVMRLRPVTSPAPTQAPGGLPLQ